MFEKQPTTRPASLSMNRPAGREVLECASPLALFDGLGVTESGRGLPHSKTLARSSWSQCTAFGPWQLPMNLCPRLPAAVGGAQQFEGAPSIPPATRRLEVAGTGSGAEIAAVGRPRIFSSNLVGPTCWSAGLLLALLTTQANAQTNLLVALDGSAQFKSVQAAIMSVPAGSAANPVVIRIKPGIYKENIYVQREKRFFRLIGEDAEKTVLTYDLHANLNGPDGRPLGTFRTPSTVIDADDFVAERITFENSAGPVGQALAIRLDGDRGVFRDCRFLGWQDTILANRGRHYFTNCYVAGHVDFIFGAATAFFDRCRIHCLRTGYITAASTPADVPHGYVFSRCTITGEPGVKTFLGRPWRDHAAVVWLNTEMSDAVRPEGWDNWKLPHREATARYAEFQSTGPGAKPEQRAKWAKQLTEAEARELTAAQVLRGADGWQPQENR